MSKNEQKKCVCVRASGFHKLPSQFDNTYNTVVNIYINFFFLLFFYFFWMYKNCVLNESKSDNGKHWTSFRRSSFFFLFYFCYEWINRVVNKNFVKNRAFFAILNVLDFVQGHIVFVDQRKKSTKVKALGKKNQSIFCESKWRVKMYALFYGWIILYGNHRLTCGPGNSFLLLACVCFRNIESGKIRNH